jgi:acyl-CoA thioesterase FadM
MMLFHRLRIANQLFLGAVHNKHGPVNVAKLAGLTLNTNVAPFRCWPVDYAFGHMNNAAFITVAELSRWRMITELGLTEHVFSKRALIVVSEQSVSYKKPILFMREYVVSTTIRVSEDDKWLHYCHSFEQFPDTVEDGCETIKYAEVNVKAVFKSNGKTIKPSELMAASPFFRNMFLDSNKEIHISN